MLTRIQIYVDYDDPFTDNEEDAGAIVEFHGTDKLNTDRFYIPYPRSVVLKEYVARLCLVDWLTTRPKEDLPTLMYSTRQMPVVAVRAIDITADKEHVCVEFIGSDGVGVRYFLVPYPRGRIMLEHAARVIVEERVDVAMVMAAKKDQLPNAVPQPVKQAAE